jgi:hypothetical protein
VAATLASGCSSLAKLRLSDGEEVRGKILGADAEAIYLTFDEADVAQRDACQAACEEEEARQGSPAPDELTCDALCGEPGVVLRAELDSLDHPGAVQSLVAGILLGVGLVPVIVGLAEMSQTGDENNTWVTAGAPVAVLGAILLSIGLPRYLSSRSRLDDPPPRGRLPK